LEVERSPHRKILLRFTPRVAADGDNPCVRIFNKKPAAPPSNQWKPDPGMAEDAFRRFQATWPTPQTMVSWWPAIETVADLQEGTHMKVVGVLLLTQDLLALCWLEQNTGIVHITPLPRVTEISLEGLSLPIIAAHPRKQHRYLGSLHQLVDTPGLEDSFVAQRRDFVEALITRIPSEPPTRDSLWPGDGWVGVGADWARPMSDEQLQTVMGYYRLLPA
jgi:hypothetical protein